MSHPSPEPIPSKSDHESARRMEQRQPPAPGVDSSAAAPASSPNAARDAEGWTIDLKEFAVRDYELKTNYLTNHYSRMWTRFGMFVTLEAAVAAVMLFEGKLTDAAPYLATVGGTLSLVWFVMGRQDRHLVRIFKYQVEDAAETLKGHGLRQDYLAVSDVVKVNLLVRSQVTGSDLFLEGRGIQNVPHIPALIPAMLTVGWIILIGVLTL